MPSYWMRLPPKNAVRKAGPCPAVRAAKVADIESISPGHIDPAQWMQAVGIARHACAHILRNGGGPADVLAMFGLRAQRQILDWSTVAVAVAERLCAHTGRPVL